jgi:acetylornithine deacetylase
MYKMDIVELARDLIKIPSPSGEEKEVGLFIVERLKNNFDVKIQEVGNRFNIFAIKGKPNVILTTHMDTVPKQIKINEDEINLYGRGSCDAKGILACMICACEEALQKGLDNFGMVFDVSEETDFTGILKAKDEVNPKFSIVGEPTDFKIVFGQKGLIQLKVKCKGKSAPGSTPEKGISAIDKLIEILGSIKKINLPKDEKLGKTTINIGEISGGSAPNVVSENAEATIEIRTTKPNKEVIQLLRDVVPNECLEINYEYESVLNENPSFIKKFSFEKISVPYFTEMYFWAKKSKTIVFGPGKYEFAHSDEEQIKKEDLVKGKEIFLKMIEEFCKCS